MSAPPLPMRRADLAMDEEHRHLALSCDALMEKYAADVPGRPKGFYPRLDHITVYAIQVERLTGKEIKLPPASAQWPELDRTKSPNVPFSSADR